jgi:hypothetical protein
LFRYTTRFMLQQNKNWQLGFFLKANLKVKIPN